MGNRKAREFIKQHAQQQEWQKAWERVLWGSRRRTEDVSIPGLGRWRVQLLHEPSFDQGYCWEMRLIDDKFRLFRSDVVKSYSGLTVLRGYQEIDADLRELEHFFQRLCRITLPIGPHISNTGGLDGTLFELALIGDLSTSVRFQWWSDPPAQWQELGPITSEMIEAFKSWKPFKMPCPDESRRATPAVVLGCPADAGNAGEITFEEARVICGEEGCTGTPFAGDAYALGDGWWFGDCFVGSFGLIVDRADGHVHRLGSAMGMRAWMFAHRCGFRHKRYHWTITAAHNEGSVRTLLSKLRYDTSSLDLSDLPLHLEFSWMNYDFLDEIARADFMDYTFTVTDCSYPICRHIGREIPDFRHLRMGDGYETDFSPERMDVWGGR